MVSWMNCINSELMAEGRLQVALMGVARVRKRRRIALGFYTKIKTQRTMSVSQQHVMS